MAGAFNGEASTLLCSENRNLRLEDIDCDRDPSPIPDDGRSDPFGGFSLPTEESVSLMVQREREHLPREGYLQRLRSGDLDLGVRGEAIDWICKAHALLNFEPLSMSLSVNYLDRFLSLHQLPRDRAWTVQLLAVACLSLAAKMRETLVPRSLDLQVGEPRYVFDAKSIQRMELLVLSKLDWRMQVLTPFAFIDYFLSKSRDGQLPPKLLISRSAQLILNTARAIDFLEFKQSEIAAAVALFVSREICAQAVDNIDGPTPCFINIEKDRLSKCVDLIGDLSMTGRCGGNGYVPQSPIGVLDAALFQLQEQRHRSRAMCQ